MFGQRLYTVAIATCIKYIHVYADLNEGQQSKRACASQQGVITDITCIHTLAYMKVVLVGLRKVC